MSAIPARSDAEFFKAGVILSDAAGRIRQAARTVTAEASKAMFLTKDWSVCREAPDGRVNVHQPASELPMQTLTERASELAKLADEIERFSAWLTYTPEESA